MAEKLKITYDEILMNEEFLAFMKKRDEKSSLYWKKFIEDNKEVKTEYEKAVSLYNILTNHKKVKYPEDIKQESVDRIMNLINASDKDLHVKKGRFSGFYILKIAASVVVLMGLCWILATKFRLFDGFNKDVYHTIIVPSGEKSQVYLADGTKIWLNSESKLKYRARFKKSERSVFLEGEGYFDVSKQKGSHFTVFTQDIKVEALGTVFNIKSYPEDRTIETTLVEGSLKVEHNNKNRFAQVILKPNERFVYRKYDPSESRSPGEKTGKKESKSAMRTVKPIQQITINKVNTDNITCWKDYLLVFDNETLEEMAVKMSRWYKLKVIILDNDLKKHRFTGKFINNETIYNVLEAIDLTTPIKYTVKDTMVIIDFDKERPITERIK